MIAKKLLHTRYRVDDLEKTVQFYKTVLGLAETARRDLKAAIRMLQAVDADIPPQAARVFAGPEHRCAPSPARWIW